MMLEIKRYKIILIIFLIISAGLSAAFLFYRADFGIERKMEFEGGEQSTGQSFKIEPLKQEFVVNDSAQNYGGQKITAENVDNLPDAASFGKFNYDASRGKIISVSGTCSDVYYVFLVFDSKNDYKKDPALAKISVSFECPANRRYGNSVDLRKFNLISGDYYFFIADQGRTGMWYNPR